ncbi:hypothetical protein [Fertoeibacter niger]|nr:hypothetical protein [Fertoeibacter niger]
MPRLPPLPRAMLRSGSRATLHLLLVASLALTVWTGAEIARDPLVRPFAERGAAEIIAATDRMLAAEATPQVIAARLTSLLAEDPRNWLAIEAVEGVAAERGIALPPALLAQRAAAWDADSGFWANAGDCATCIWDAATCNLQLALMCQAPVALTPLGDIAGISRAGVASITGGEVDEIDLALSVVGLSATALVIATGGSSAVVKVGAGLGKLARRMGLLSPALTRVITTQLRAGVDLAALPAVRSADDLAAVVRVDALAPLGALATDLGRLRDATGTTEALHLLRYVDDGAEARRLANAAEALGPRVVGRIEVLGKSRFLRATLRWSDALWQMFAGLAGLLGAAVGVLGGAAQSLGLRLLRRLAG